jgi:hypothetical protein
VLAVWLFISWGAASRQQPTDDDQTPTGLVEFGETAFHRYKNNIFSPPKCLYCTSKTPILQKKGAETVQFLVKHFNFLGFDGQYWMLVAVGLIAASILIVWRTQYRS